MVPRTTGAWAGGCSGQRGGGTSGRWRAVVLAGQRTPALCLAAGRAVVPGRRGLPLRLPGRAQPPAGGHGGDSGCPGRAEPDGQHLQEAVSDAGSWGHRAGQERGQGSCRQAGAGPVPGHGLHAGRELTWNSAGGRISSGMFCAGSPGCGGTGSLQAAWPPARGWLGVARLGRVGGSQPGETEAPSRHAVPLQPPGQGLALKGRHN